MELYQQAMGPQTEDEARERIETIGLRVSEHLLRDYIFCTLTVAELGVTAVRRLSLLPDITADVTVRNECILFLNEI